MICYVIKNTLTTKQFKVVFDIILPVFITAAQRGWLTWKLSMTVEVPFTNMRT